MNQNFFISNKIYSIFKAAIRYIEFDGNANRYSKKSHRLFIGFAKQKNLRKIFLNNQKSEIIAILQAHAQPKNAEGMMRFGITSSVTILGVPSKIIFSLAKEIGTNHRLALELWKSGYYESRILAAIIADRNCVTRSLMQLWARDFDNWAICDGVCIHCFRYSPYAYNIVPTLVKSKKEFARRAGFSLIAALTVSDKKSNDETFIRYLKLVQLYSTDDRQYVKKAVNWALRQIGKRNLRLNAAAINTAKGIYKLDSASAHWIASDALRELQSKAVQNRLRANAKHVVKNYKH